MPTFGLTEAAQLSNHCDMGNSPKEEQAQRLPEPAPSVQNDYESPTPKNATGVLYKSCESQVSCFFGWDIFFAGAYFEKKNASMRLYDHHRNPTQGTVPQRSDNTRIHNHDNSLAQSESRNF